MAQVTAKADLSATSYFTKLLNSRWGWLIYALACLITGQLVAYLGILYFGHDWDKELIKPSVTQFNWVFFVLVWVVNYSTMGVAAWYVWRQQTQPNRKRALRWFWFQYGLSLLWLPIVHGRAGWVPLLSWT